MPFSLRLFPRQDHFFDMLRRSAENVLTGTKLLMRLMDEYGDPEIEGAQAHRTQER